LFKYSVLKIEEYEQIKSILGLLSILKDARKTAQAETLETEADLWLKVLGQLSKQLSSASFETWFTDTIGEVTGNTMIIHCKNSFQRDWLEDRYEKSIGKSIQDLTGKTYKIEYLVAEIVRNH
jgi:hypothetical protein